MNNGKTILMCALALFAGCFFGATGMHVYAQQSGIQRVVLQRFDVSPASAPQEAILGTAEIPAGTAAGKHTHSGIEIGYVLSGEALMEIAGEPPRTLRAGDSYVIPAGKVHDAKVTGAAAAKVIAVYLVEKGKPLAAPAS